MRAIATDTAELVFVPAEKLKKLIKDNYTIGTEVLRAMSDEVAIVRQKIAMFGGRARTHANK